VLPAAGLLALVNDFISKRIVNASQKSRPLWLCHASSDNNALTVSHLETHTVICYCDRVDTPNRTMNLVVELKVNAATFEVLLISLSTK
jgi:hypothetical protein